MRAPSSRMRGKRPMIKRGWHLAALLFGIVLGAGEGRTEPPTGGPPQTLTVEQAIRTGIERHPRIQIAEHEVLASKAMTGQIEAALYPRVTGIYANTGGNTRVLANLGISGSLPKPVNYLTTPGLRADYLITDFGQTAHRILANKALTEAAEKQVLTQRALVILNVQRAYLTCLKEQHLVTIAEALVKERRLVAEQAETYYRHNLRSKLELDFASVELDRAEVAWIRAKNDLRTAFAALANAMGVPQQETYTLQDDPVVIQPVEPLESLFEQALQQRPELLGSQFRVRAAKEALSAAKALNFGNITAIGTFAYTWWSRVEITSSKGNPNNPGAQQGWYGAGATSAVPLFTGGRIEGQIDEAEARQGEQEAETRVIGNDIVLQVARAYFSQATAEQQIAVAKDRLAHAREALSLAEARYKASLGSILDVTTATADLLAAEVGLTETEYEYRASQAALRFATGRDVTRF